MRLFLFLIISYLYINANSHIFVYHRFGDEKHASTNTSLKELEKEFQYFKDNGYEVVPLSNIIDKLKKEEKIPNNWIALTIDDAYKSFYTNGLPIFKKYNYPFTLFVYVKATQKRYKDYMNWDEIKEASKYGEIGLHSYDHPHLLNLSNEQILNDTKRSYEKFRQLLGFKPKYYAYPYGEYNDRVKEQIKKFEFQGEQAFDAILNQNSGSVNINSDRFDINRIALVGKVNIKQKLRYNTLDVKWIEPKEFPKDSFLKRVKAKVDKNIKNLKLYITGEGWRDIKVQNGMVDLDLNVYLKRARTRVILGTDYYTISNRVITKRKDNYATK